MNCGLLLIFKYHKILANVENLLCNHMRRLSNSRLYAVLNSIEMISFQFEWWKFMIYLNYSVIYQVISDIFLNPLILLRSIFEENDGWQSL